MVSTSQQTMTRAPGKFVRNIQHTTPYAVLAVARVNKKPEKR